MFANSRSVTSNQTGIHSDLDRVVRRHLQSPWRAPIADHDAQAFARLQQWRQAQGAERALILDSGCGTGRSSLLLARQQPEALVVGVDQSAVRLERASKRFQLPDNLLLLRADCAGLWRLIAGEGWQLQRHQILYPNPWPKSAHLKRRWHGHPVWPTMLSLGGELEMRSNWLLYLQEVRDALAISDIRAELSQLPMQSEPLTDFEEKYQASGQVNWRLTASL
ncbi:tRNA (guanine(46)-N(7))-methyltransferase TrmB [Alcanivorax sp. IL2]|uniref:tRNA (guanine(46)-N(7))-methyltransferase TrmB n=1 Tax=Alcanivorax sp. IL2 TaxID=3396310 RepID=UPI0039C3DEF5